MLREVANFAAVFVVVIFILSQNHLHSCNAQNYDVQSICDMSDGNARVSIDHASYSQLHFGMDVHSKVRNECEIVLQTTYSGDGLLVSFQHFDFMGSNSATVFADRECSATLKAWDGEFYYISTCIGPALSSAPPTVTFSSIGTVRLQLIFRNMSKTIDSASKAVTFTIVATASQKASFGERCNNGCCQPPYTFRCPRMELCIDRKLACNNVSNCGPSSGNMNDENGPLCPVIATDFPPPAKTGVVRKPKETMLNPLWVHDTNSFATSVDSASTPNREYFAKVEMVCGFAFTIFFCVTGITILLCKMHGRPCKKPPATPTDRYQFRSTNPNPASGNDTDQPDTEPQTASTSNPDRADDGPPTYSSLASISVVGVNETAPAHTQVGGVGAKSSDAPPSYEILYPKKLTDTPLEV